MASKSIPSLAAILTSLLFISAGAVRVGLDVEKGEPANGKRAASLLERDLSELHESFYAHYEVNKSAAWNAKNAFRHFQERAQLLGGKTGTTPDEHFASNKGLEENEDDAFRKDEPKVMGRESLTEEELQDYEDRFMAELGVEARHDRLLQIKDETERDRVWAKEVGASLQDQKPVATQSLQQTVNSLNLGWTADAIDSVTHMSMHDAHALNGVVKTQKDKEDMSEVYSLFDDGSSSSLAETSWPWSSPKVDLPEYFDLWAKWGDCKKVLDHVRDQGSCGSCWAQSAAYVLETRLCIDSGAKFSGDSAWLSSIYLTSCSKPSDTSFWKFWQDKKPGDGCQGGTFQYVFDFVRKHGVPTGSKDHREGHTCLPYSLTGDSLQHFDPTQKPPTPACQTACTNFNFRRTLQQDLHKLSFSYSATKKTDKAKQAIYESGPVVFDYAVYRDFMSYSSGVYTPISKDKGSFTGYHSTACIGFGKDPQYGDYLFCRNSWGTRWGINGNFKINPEPVLLEYGIAGKINVQKSTIPSA